jgi:hypothetical protein
MTARIRLFAGVLGGNSQKTSHGGHGDTGNTEKREEEEVHAEGAENAEGIRVWIRY